MNRDNVMRYVWSAVAIELVIVLALVAVLLIRAVQHT